MSDLDLVSPDQEARCKNIRLVLMDVDGVWTDGKLYYMPDAQGQMVEVKGFDSQDGMGLRWAHAAGLQTGVISARESTGLTHRAQMLGVTYIYQGHLDKIGPYEEILRQTGLTNDQVAYLGDDLIDVPLFDRVGLAVAVSNARPEAMRHAHYITQAPGGNGAIREVLQLIMQVQNTWKDVLEKYGIEGET
ncbi:MAG: HAD hydrolase family protein [Candidatus Latescibacteria bacterium]|nr:HAD hydrolase family protein [Candidatus Latescibacterota bacterium]